MRQGTGAKKRAYERLYVLPNFYVCLCVLPNLYVRANVRSYMLPNLYRRSNVLPKKIVKKNIYNSCTPLYHTPRTPPSQTWVPQRRLAFGHHKNLGSARFSKIQIPDCLLKMGPNCVFASFDSAFRSYLLASKKKVNSYQVGVLASK